MSRFVSIAALLADPANIPPDQIPAVLSHLSAIQTTLTARLLNVPRPPVSSGDADQLLTVDDASRILEVTPKWLYRHADRLPFTRRLSRKALRFSEAGLRKWLATRR